LTECAEYPVFAEKAAKLILGGECENGILICGTGIGLAIAANKIKGIRAAVCSEAYSAAMTKEHNNANIIAFGSRVVGSAVAERIVDAFIESKFQGGRHQVRVDMINALDNK
jgi:ribose 5-phosphate isomerase B